MDASSIVLLPTGDLSLNEAGPSKKTIKGFEKKLVVLFELTQRSCEVRFLRRLKFGSSGKVRETLLKRPYKSEDKSRVLTSGPLN